MKKILSTLIFIALCLPVLAQQTIISDPSSGSCSDAGSANTGNGTCTISTTHGFVVSETVTFTATTVGPAATFSVSGSSSGSLGTITSGSAQIVYDSNNYPVLTLTLSDGATPYIIGDDFEVTTTPGTELKEATFDLFDATQVCLNGCDIDLGTSTDLGITATTGDATTTYTITGDVWLFGIDNSDFDRVKIGYTDFSASNSFLALKTSGEVLIGASGSTVNHEVRGAGLLMTASNSGSVNQIRVENSSNTSASDALMQMRVGGSSGGDPYLLFNIDAVQQYYWAIDNSDSDNLVLGTGSTVGSGVSAKIDSSGNIEAVGTLEPSGGLVGTDTNDSASSGHVGEAVRSLDSIFDNLTTTATFQDITSISLSAGDWDVSGIVAQADNSSTTTGCRGAISINSGNTTTDHEEGDNEVAFGPATTDYNQHGSIPSYRLSLSGTTTVYLKGRCSFSAGNPQMKGRISARRVR